MKIAALLPTGNPETWGQEQISVLIGNAINVALLIGGGVAVIFIIIGAFGYFTAYGNEEKAKKAKTTIIWAIVGVVVILIARVLIAEIWNLITTEDLKFPV